MGRGEEPWGQAAAGGRQWRAVPRINSPNCLTQHSTPRRGRARDLFCVNSGEWKGVKSPPKVEKHLVYEY